MRYTITALSPTLKTIEIMRQSLLAVGAPGHAITISMGTPDISQHQIQVKTDDLEKSETYRDALELAGGIDVASNEESSVFNAVTMPRRQDKHCAS